MLLQKPRECQRILTSTLVAQAIGLQAALNQEGGMRIKVRTHGDELRPQLLHQRFVGDDRTGQHIAMAIGILG